MEMTQEQRLAEKELREEAEQTVRKHGVKPGETVNKETNPPPGSPGHLCCDPKGRYRPTWFTIKIHRRDDGSTPNRQFFNIGGKKFRVLTGTWVDVPPVIVNALENAVVEVISMNVSEADPLVQDYVPMVVDSQPRFMFSVRVSA